MGKYKWKIEILRKAKENIQKITEGNITKENLF